MFRKYGYYYKDQVYLVDFEDKDKEFDIEFDLKDQVLHKKYRVKQNLPIYKIWLVLMLMMKIIEILLLPN